MTHEILEQSSGPKFYTIRPLLAPSVRDDVRQPLRIGDVMWKTAVMLGVAWVLILLERFASVLGWTPLKLFDPMSLIGTLIIGASALYVFSHVRSIATVRRTIGFALLLLLLFTISDTLDEFAWVQDYIFLGKRYALHAVMENMLWTGSGIFMVAGFYYALLEAELARQSLSEKQASLSASLESQKRAEEALLESEVRYRSLVELSPVAFVVEANNAIVYTNTAFMKLLGLEDREPVLRHSILDYVHPEDRDDWTKRLRRLERQGGRGEFMVGRLVRSDGAIVDVETGNACVVYEGKVGVQISIQDITDRKRMEMELRHLSRNDKLTGIANRRLFDEMLSLECRRAERTHLPVSLLLADVDLFKAYNDHYGRPAGDACLRRVAETLKSKLRRPSDIAARYGGEEFAIILPNTTIEGAAKIAEEMRERIVEMNQPHEGSHISDRITISVGIATTVPGQITRPEQLISGTDKALYHAKESGRNQVQIYRPV